MDDITKVLKEKKHLPIVYSTKLTFKNGEITTLADEELMVSHQ
jgi:hypothetical protein